MDNELALRLFVSVVEANSFSKGGARLNVPQSSASRMVSRLEERLGARLLQRSTRNLTLTEAGKIYFERAARIVTDLNEAAEVIRDINAAPTGVLRVLAPTAFGRLILTPLLPEFHERYPDISIGMSLSDGVEDIIGRGFDVAIRSGELQDSNLIATRLIKMVHVTCAAPAYLKKHGTPQNVAELAQHNCLQFRFNPGQNTWRFRSETEEFDVQVDGNLYADSGDVLLAGTLAGLGISYLPQWLVHTHLQDGSLQLVLPQLAPFAPISPIQAVAGYRQHVPAKQRVFVEFLREKFAEMSWGKS